MKVEEKQENNVVLNEGEIKSTEENVVQKEEPETYPETYDETQEEQQEEEWHNEPPIAKEPKPKYEGIIIKTRDKKNREGIYKKNIEDKTEKYPFIETNDEFKHLIRLLNGVADEHTLKFTEKELTITTVDDAHVSLLNLNIDYNHSMFKEMEIPYPLELTLDTKILGDILKAFSSSFILIPKDNTLTVKDDVKQYTLPTLIDTKTNPKIPNIDEGLKTHIMVDVDRFKDVVRDCKRIGEHIRFETKKNGDVLVSGENDSNVVFFETILPHKKNIENSSGEGKSMFSLDLLEKIFGIEEFTSEVEILYGTDMPIKIQSNILEKKYNKPEKVSGNITYLVAPRIENE